MEHLDFAQRLAALERQNRQLRIAFGALLLIIGMLALSGFQGSRPHDLLRARKIQVVAKDGKTLIELKGMDRDGQSSIVLNNMFGGPGAELSVTHRRGSLTLGETTDRKSEGNFVAVYASSFGSYVEARDTSGVAVQLASSRGKGSVQLLDKIDNLKAKWPK